VCSLNSSQSYIDGLVANLVGGDVVNWFADVNGRGYLIGTGPMNHAGTGNSSVLAKTKADQAPPSNPAGASGDMSGNSSYSGTEAQHPGDDTPWPAPMLDIVVAINAAEFIVWGYTENRAINHSEWSNRKIDMSAGGGINSDGWSAAELRRRVAARMTGQPTTDWFDMATEEDLRRIVREEVGQRLADLDPTIRETYNRADWVNTRLVDLDPVIRATDERTGNVDPTIRQTYNLADWTNDRTIEILDKVSDPA
jgi:hypothetical protein